MLRVRWVTWWPAPYWESRFERLSTIDDIELKVYYCQKKSSMHQWPDKHRRKYSYEILCERENNEFGYSLKMFNLADLFPYLKVLKDRSDVIILPYADLMLMTIIFFCIVTRRKYFLFCANTILENRRKRFFKEILKRAIFSFSSAILATGEAQKEYSLRYVKNFKKVKIIGNPTVEFFNIFNKDFNQKDKKMFYSKRNIHLLYVGRFSKEKGLYDLLRSVSLLKIPGYRFKILMVGDGPEKNKLKEFSIKLKVDCIFTGYLKNYYDIYNMYRLADIFVLPSYSEPWGLVVNEAMQNKLPVIISDRVGCKKMLLKEGKNGYSFKSGDFKDLSDKIRLMVKSQKIELMGQESYKIIRNQNSKRWADNVVRAIHDTI